MEEHKHLSGAGRASCDRTCTWLRRDTTRAAGAGLGWGRGGRAPTGAVNAGAPLTTSFADGPRTRQCTCARSFVRIIYSVYPSSRLLGDSDSVPLLRRRLATCVPLTPVRLT